MSALLPNLHLLQPQQWKEAEKSLLHFDKVSADFIHSFCTRDSLCYPTLQFLTESLSTKIIFILFCALFLWKGTAHLPLQKRRFLLFSTALTLGVGDFLANQIKYLFQRLRPDLGLEFLLSDYEPAFSFPSNHAFNLSALATCLYLLQNKGFLKSVNFPRIIFAVALSVSLSRVLTARHYPVDVIGGLLLGCIYSILADKLRNNVAT